MAESTTILPDDVVGEILLRLDDVATLFRCAATCKAWRCLVAKPCFLHRRKWPPSLVGYFTSRHLDTETSPESWQLAFVPWPGNSTLGTHPRALNSFIHANAVAAATCDRAVPLATSGGLLLVRLYLREDDTKPKTFLLLPVCNPIVGLAVCNPLAGTWDVLPELNCQSKFRNSHEYGCEIVPTIAGDGTSLAYKVLMIGMDKDKAQYNLHTFVSGEASWRAPTKCFDMMERQVWSMECTKAVVCGGYAHWLFVSTSDYFHVLSVDTETRHVSLTKLLSPTKERLVLGDFVADEHGTAVANFMRATRELLGANRLTTTTDGTILSMHVYRARRLEIWAPQQEDGRNNCGTGDAEWCRTRVFDNKLTEQIQQLKRSSCIWSRERSGTMLITENCRSGGTYIAHLDSGTLEAFGDQTSSGIMPMEIDWPTFFMSRLGGSQ